MFSNLKPTFGSATNNASFGFGSVSSIPSNPFGQSTFGKPSTTSFSGTTSAFGSTPAPFGSTSQHGSLFGTATPSSSFGQPPAAQPAFGSSMFGSTVTQASSSTSLFGSPSTSTFGQQNKTSSFGFGSPAGNNSFFGQQPNQAQAQPQATGMFGQNTNNLFGSPPGFGGAAVGTPTGTVVKFSLVTGTDTMVKGSINQTISTRHHCITCMKEYESKSLEELRWEDYQANRKGPQQGAQPAGGLFGGMTQPVGGGLFGAPAATSSSTMFQSDNKSVFGSTASTPGFGQTNSAFGATPSTSSTALFGKPLGGFGSNTATTSAFAFNPGNQSNLFGSNTAAKPFGATAQQSNLFGQQSSGFGTQSSFGSFGAPANQNVGLFNQNKPTTPFNMGAPTGTGFGTFNQSGAPNPGSLFTGAKPAQTGFGGFGAQTSAAPVFGQATFGQPNQSLFNSTFNKPTTNLFGQTNSNTGLGTGLAMGGGSNLFGNTLAKPGNMFGTNTGMFNSGFGTTPFNSGFNMTGNPISHTLNTHNDPNNVNQEQQIISMSSSPFGLSSHLSHVTEVQHDLRDISRPTNPSELSALLHSVTKSPSSSPTDKLQPKQLYGRKVPMFEGLEQRDESLVENFRINNNPKRLMLRKNKEKYMNGDDCDSSRKSFNGSEKWVFSGNDQDSEQTSSSRLSLDSFLKNSSERVSLVIDDMTAVSNNDFDSQKSNAVELRTQPSMININEDEVDINEDIDQFLEANEHPDAINHVHETTLLDDTINGFGLQAGDLVNTFQLDSSIQIDSTSDLFNGKELHPTGIVLTRHEYYTKPSLNELMTYIDDDGACFVEGFTVGRIGYGNVRFTDVFDVANLNLDELVHFRDKEINIYPDESTKPPLGEGLNRKAQVTLDQVWPYDKKQKIIVREPDALVKMEYADRLRRLCERQGTRFVEYRPDTGSWVFKVEHFSKYGHPDSDDSDSDHEEKIKKERMKFLKKSKEKHNVSLFETPSTTPEESISGSQSSSEHYLHLKEENHCVVQTTISESHSSASLSSISNSDSSKSTSYVDLPKYTVMKSSIFNNAMDVETIDISIETVEFLTTAINMPRNRHSSPNDSSYGSSSSLSLDKSQTGSISSRSSSISSESIESHRSLDSIYESADNDIISTPSYHSNFQIHNGIALDKSRESMYMSPMTVVSDIYEAENFETPDDFVDSYSETYPMDSDEISQDSDNMYISIDSDSEKDMLNLSSSNYDLDLDILGPDDELSIDLTKVDNEFCELYEEEDFEDDTDFTLLTEEDLEDLKKIAETEGDIDQIDDDTLLDLSKNVIASDVMGWKGSCFKVGWGKGMTLLVLSDQNMNNSQQSDEEEDEEEEFLPLSIDIVKIGNIEKVHNDVSFNNTRHYMKCHMQNAVFKMVYEMPHIQPKTGFGLLESQRSFASSASHVTNKHSQYFWHIWELCAALWGKINETDLHDYDSKTIRKILLSKWLKNVVNEDVLQNLDLTDTSEDAIMFNIMTYMSGNLLKDAAKYAIQTNNARLSLFLSQLPSSPTIRHCLLKQMGLWRETGTDMLINKNIIKIHMLIAGIPVFTRKDLHINICESMDWVRMFAMYFWYISPTSHPISRAVQVYEEAFENYKCAAKPTPLYDPSIENVYDLMFHLLKFYCDTKHSLEIVLDPITHTADTLDFRLSWFLLQTFTSLGYGNVPNPVKTHICLSFSAQLEGMGLWEWAIYVLLYIEDNHVKKSIIIDVIGRHIKLMDEVTDDYENIEDMLVGEFNIPTEWIESAKANRAIIEKNYKEAVYYLIYAKRWNDAHDVIIKHFVPEHFLCYDYEYLHGLLEPLSEHKSSLFNWEGTGGLILSLTELGIQFRTMTEKNDKFHDPEIIETFKTAVVNIGSHFEQFPRHTYLHNICLAEMSSRLSEMIRFLLKAVTDKNSVDEITEARYVNMRSMPKDYLLRELLFTIEDYVSQFKKERPVRHK